MEGFDDIGYNTGLLNTVYTVDDVERVGLTLPYLYATPVHFLPINIARYLCMIEGNGTLARYDIRITLCG